MHQYKENLNNGKLSSSDQLAEVDYVEEATGNCKMSSSTIMASYPMSELNRVYCRF